MFGFLAPIYKAGLPSSPLQSHLRQLENLTSFCDNILAIYFSSDHPCKITAHTHWKYSHFWGSSLVKSTHIKIQGRFHIAYIRKHKKIPTNMINIFLLLTSFSLPALLFVSALFLGADWPNTVRLPLTLCYLLLLLLLWAHNFSAGPPPPVQETMDANLQKLTQLVNKESNLIEKVLLLFISSLHGFMVAFGRYSLSCTIYSSVSY